MPRLAQAQKQLLRRRDIMRPQRTIPCTGAMVVDRLADRARTDGDQVVATDVGVARHSSLVVTMAELNAGLLAIELEHKQLRDALVADRLHAFLHNELCSWFILAIA
jgi:hypothetical protein